MNIANQIPSGGDTTMMWAKAYEEPEQPPYWEQALVVLWFLVLFVPIPFSTPLRYALVGFFVMQFALHKEQIIPVLFKAWPLFLLPIFGLASVLWAPSFGAALRSGVLYLLTPFVVIVIISRMQMSTVLRCMFFAGVGAVLYSAPYYAEMHLGGPFPQKNFFAQQMLFVCLLSLVTLLSQKALAWTRMLAAVIFPVALIFMLRAPSATALVFAAVGIVGLVAVRFFWVGASKIRHLRTMIFLSGLTLVLCLAMFVLNQPSENYIEDFLAALGKDTTFTGRTHIWAAGEIAAAENPMFGTGLEGFWQIWNGAAQSILENDFKPYGVKLTFHNAYLEVQVHLGYIGLSLYILMWVWCGYRLFKQWFEDASLEMSALLIFGAIVFVSTFTESLAWSTFNTPVNMLYFAAAAGLSPVTRKFVGTVPVMMKSNRGFGQR